MVSCGHGHSGIRGHGRCGEIWNRHAAQPEGITATGKTGTAPGLNTPYSHGFFVGYAPADKPEIVLVVYLEHSRGVDAAAIAGPIFTAYVQAMHRASQ